MALPNKGQKYSLCSVTEAPTPIVYGHPYEHSELETYLKEDHSH